MIKCRLHVLLKTVIGRSAAHLTRIYYPSVVYTFITENEPSAKMQ